MANRDESLGVGLVGCGIVAGRRHLPALQQIEGVHAAALADVDPERLKALGDRFVVEHRYAAYHRLLEHPGIDVVAILVPTRFHVEVALAALEAGKHVLVEKPLALSLDDCERLIEHASRSSTTIMVGFNLRWHRLVLKARDSIRQGTLGQIKSIRSVYTHWRPAEAPDPWKAQRELGGGVVMNEAVHHFDLWRFLLGTEVEEVSALCQASDQFQDETATVIARMEDGVLATGVFSLKTSGNNELEIYGERGRLYLSCYRFDGLEFYANTAYAGNLSHRLRRGLRTVAELPQAIRAWRQGSDFDVTYAAEWRDLVRLIREGGEPRSTLEDGTRALQVALAVLASASWGRPVQVSNAPRDIVAPAKD